MNSLVVLLLPLLLVPSATAGAAMSRGLKVLTLKQDEDRLRMCPPGGSSFTMAWSMACSMRRKRSADPYGPMVREQRALVAPSIRQMQSICCEVGCTITDLLPYCGPLSAW